MLAEQRNTKKMIRLTLEETTWEIYKELGNDLLDYLSPDKKSFLIRVFGIFPYQPHSLRQMSKILNISYSSTRTRYKQILKELKVKALTLYKTA